MDALAAELLSYRQPAVQAEAEAEEGEGKRGGRKAECVAGGVAAAQGAQGVPAQVGRSSYLCCIHLIA